MNAGQLVAKRKLVSCSGLTIGVGRENIDSMTEKEEIVEACKKECEGSIKLTMIIFRFTDVERVKEKLKNPFSAPM